MKFRPCLLLSTLLALFGFALPGFAKTIAVYDLQGTFKESVKSPKSIFELSATASRPLTHFDLVQALQKVIHDDDVTTVVLEVDQASFSLASLQEIHRLLNQIKAAKKEIYLYTESLNFKTALLGSTATQLTLVPEGNVQLNGLFSETLYLKGFLDKIGTKVDVVHIGDYKSAGETLTRTGPSEAAEQQNAALLDSLYNQLVTQLSEARKISPDDLRKHIDKGLLTAEEALKAGLVDKLQYRTDLIADLYEHFGDDAEIVNGYGLPDTSAPEIKGFMDVLKIAFRKPKNVKLKKPYLAVVAFEGVVTDETIAPIRTEILRIANDDQCKGAVLRVNSPGGSALSSEILWEATTEFIQSKKPLYVSMAQVAASGGYYISSSADRIFAEPSTITGSIGVIGMKLAIGGTMEKLGITTHETKRGEHADLYNASRPFNATEESLVRGSMETVYTTFKKRVTDGRGKRLKKDIEQIAGGRVYSGEDALAIGLVDELGGLTEAIALLRKTTKLPKAPAIFLPEPLDPLTAIFNQHQNKEDPNGEFIRVNPSSAQSLFQNPQALLKTYPALRLLPQTHQQQLQRNFQLLQSIRKHQVQLLAPALNY